jgi:hypothetical protein
VKRFSCECNLQKFSFPFLYLFLSLCLSLLGFPHTGFNEICMLIASIFYKIPFFIFLWYYNYSRWRESLPSCLLKDCTESIGSSCLFRQDFTWFLFSSSNMLLPQLMGQLNSCCMEHCRLRIDREREERGGGGVGEREKEYKALSSLCSLCSLMNTTHYSPCKTKLCKI